MVNWLVRPLMRVPTKAAIMAGYMLRTVIVTGTIAFAILAVILVLTVVQGATLGAEYLEFVLALTMFLVILVGSYWFVVRGPGRFM
jgi:ABC-type nickel/cobalt efflux system permease component RcnA